MNAIVLSEQFLDELSFRILLCTPLIRPSIARLIIKRPIPIILLLESFPLKIFPDENKIIPTVVIITEIHLRIDGIFTPTAISERNTGMIFTDLPRTKSG